MKCESCKYFDVFLCKYNDEIGLNVKIAKEVNKDWKCPLEKENNTGYTAKVFQTNSNNLDSMFKLWGF